MTRLRRWLRRHGYERCRDCGYTERDWEDGIPGLRRGVVHAGHCTWRLP
jgi:hypothetical protein